MKDDDPLSASERRLADNLRAARENAGLSGSAAAALMRERGHLWHQQTVSQAENGQKYVRATEAGDLAQIYGTSVEALMRPPGLARTAWSILSVARDLRGAQQAVKDATLRRDNLARRLAGLVTAARDDGTAERMETEIGIAAGALKDAGFEIGAEKPSASRQSGQGTADNTN